MINQINTQLPQIMEHKNSLVLALKDLTAAIVGFMAMIAGFISNYTEMIGSVGSVITWFLSTALILMTLYYYWINSKYKREQLKRIRKENKDKQKDDDDTPSDSTNK